MFIIDLNQVLFATFFASIRSHTNIEIEESLIRHMALNTIRAINVKFRKDYGQLILASDSRENWRRNEFPQYKAARRKSRSKSDVDWKTIFACMDTIKIELIQYFPYKFVEVRGAEADDVIGVLVKRYSEVFNENVLIVSGDKDFRQLLNSRVQQYDPTQKKYIREPDPKSYLQEHILRGDISDGVPNVLSEDNIFTTNKRQKSLTKKMLIKLSDSSTTEYNKYIRNIMRNRTLIDLSFTPKEIQDKIISAAERQQEVVDKSLLLPYMMKYKLRNLTQSISDF